METHPPLPNNPLPTSGGDRDGIFSLPLSFLFPPWFRDGFFLMLGNYFRRCSVAEVTAPPLFIWTGTAILSFPFWFVSFCSLSWMVVRVFLIGPPPFFSCFTENYLKKPRDPFAFLSPPCSRLTFPSSPPCRSPQTRKLVLWHNFVHNPFVRFDHIRIALLS